MDFTKLTEREEKLAELYVKTKELLAESAGIPTRKMWEILGNTLLAQIQGTAYWMGRALEAERKLVLFQPVEKTEVPDKVACRGEGS